MPLTLIHDSGYCHGIPKAGVPVIPSFRVIARPGHWLMAERRNKTYIVRETPTHWVMERFGPDIWSRHAERQRRNRHECRIISQRQGWWNLQSDPELRPRNFWMLIGAKRKGYAGERLKGVWALDTSEAVAVRKAEA